MKLKEAVVAFVLSVALAVSGSGVVHASPGEDPPPSGSCSATEGGRAALAVEEDQGVINWATEKAEEIVDSGVVEVHAPGGIWNHAESTVIRVETGGAQYSSVTIPVQSGGDFSLLSNFTVVMDSEGAVVTYAETLVTQNSNGNFHLTSYADGELMQNIDSTEPFVDNEVLQKKIDEVNASLAAGEAVVTPSGLGAVAACLATVLGIGGGTAWVIATLCGGSCAGAATGVGAAICAACIGGIATLGAGAIAGAVACFGYL